MTSTVASSAAGTSPLREVVRTWWPLAASWLLMGAEMPLVSAAVARLADPEIHLAAWGSVVFPVALLVEAPIIMLLAASTALSKDGHSYRKLLRFTTWSGAVLTGIHALLAFTPLYDLILVPLLKTPVESIAPGRLGLQVMTPWTWAIADRRFHQGVLIREGRSRAVGLGTAARLVVTSAILGTGLLLRGPGIVVAGAAIASSVVAEMIVVRIAVAPVLPGVLARNPETPPLTTRSMLAFYLPLAMTPLLTLLMQPIGSAALGRMPEALACLAAWPALNSLVFLIRSSGFAFNEVVVRHAGDPRVAPGLRSFTVLLSWATGLVLVLIAVTPLSRLYFHNGTGLSEELTSMSVSALWFALLLPPAAVLQNYYQGLLTHARETRAVTEAVFLHLITTAALLQGGVIAGRWNGLLVVVVAYSVGSLVQVWWLRRRALRAMKAVDAVSS